MKYLLDTTFLYKSDKFYTKGSSFRPNDPIKLFLSLLNNEILNKSF